LCSLALSVSKQNPAQQDTQGYWHLYPYLMGLGK
jgi:hypothetical protein